MKSVKCFKLEQTMSAQSARPPRRSHALD